MSGDLIGEYLAALRAGLRTPPARTAEILAEAEDHLRESVAAALQGGHLSDAAAQRAAIEAFGPVKAVTRAHRPSLSAFAAAAALQSWPLLAVYVLLSAVLGGLTLGLNGDRAFVPAQTPPNGRFVEWQLVRPSVADLAATFGVFFLIGVVLIVGLLVIRRRTRRSGLALLRLPRGLLPLIAAVVLLAAEVVWYQVLRSYELGRLHGVSSTRELFAGGQDSASLLGLGCVLWFLIGMVGNPVEAGSRRPMRQPGVTAYAVEAGLAACQLLGGYLLLTALIGGQFGPLVGSLGAGLSSGWPYIGPEAVIFYGCVVGGALLAAGPLLVRQRRQLSVRLPRGVASLIAVFALAALGYAEYRFFAGDVMGSLHVSPGIGELVLCSQWAAVLLGSAWAVRTLVSLVQWALPGRRGTGKAASPEGANLATAG